MKSTTACDDQFIAGEDLSAGDLVIQTPEGVLVKGKLYVKPPAPPAPPPKTYGVFVGDPNVGTEKAIAPAVAEKLMQILSESARPDVPADRLECPDEWSDEHKQIFSRWVHEELQNNARRSIIERARAMLQSAEVKS